MRIPIGRHWGTVTRACLALSPALLIPREGRAQDDCGAFVARSELYASGVRAEPAPLLLVARLDSAMARGARAFRLRQPGGPAVDMASVLGETASEVAEVVRDSNYASAVALTLGSIMRGPEAGFSEDQAAAASALYSLLHLPPAAAIAVLADPLEDGPAKVRSLGALGPAIRDHPLTPGLRDAIASSLCIVDNRATALAGLLRNPRGHAQSPPQSASDLHLFSLLILNTYVDGDGARPRFGFRLREVLDPGGPLAARIRVLTPSLW